MKTYNKIDNFVGIYKAGIDASKYTIIIDTPYILQGNRAHFELALTVNSRTALDAAKLYDACTAHLNSLLLTIGLRTIRRHYNRPELLETITSKTPQELIIMLENKLARLETGASTKILSANKIESNEQLKLILRKLICQAKLNINVAAQSTKSEHELSDTESLPDELAKLISSEIIDYPYTTDESITHILSTNATITGHRFYSLEEHIEAGAFSNPYGLYMPSSSSSSAALLEEKNLQQLADNWRSAEMFFHRSILPKISTTEELLEDVFKALLKNNAFANENEILVRINAKSTAFEIYQGQNLVTPLIPGEAARTVEILGCSGYRNQIMAILAKFKQMYPIPTEKIYLYFIHANNTPTCKISFANVRKTFVLRTDSNQNNSKRMKLNS